MLILSGIGSSSNHFTWQRATWFSVNARNIPHWSFDVTSYGQKDVHVYLNICGRIRVCTFLKLLTLMLLDMQYHMSMLSYLLYVQHDTGCLPYAHKRSLINLFFFLGGGSIYMQIKHIQRVFLLDVLCKYWLKQFLKWLELPFTAKGTMDNQNIQTVLIHKCSTVGGHWLVNTTKVDWIVGDTKYCMDTFSLSWY